MFASMTGFTLDNRPVLCDVDEVCADLMSEWLKRYNKEWDDTLAKEHITGWDIVKFVRPECGNGIYDLLRRGNIYDRVAPIAGALEGVRALRAAGHRVVFVSSCVVGSTDDKMRWLIRHGFLRNEKTPRDFVAAKDKSMVRGSVLIDDAPHNVDAYPGRTILFSQPHNQHVDHPLRADSWDDVVEHVTALR